VIGTAVDWAIDQAAQPARRRQVTRLAGWLLPVVAVGLPLVLDPIALRRTASLVVLALAVLGVVVATGYTGLISLGHGAFVGLGAFAMGAFVDHLSMPFPLAVAASFACCWAAGWLLGLPALRVRGVYLALITLGLAVVFPSLAKRFPAVTGGVTGRPIDATLDAPAWLGDDHTVTWRYFFCLLVVAIMFVLTGNVVRGRPGRAMRAVRDGETAAATFGVRAVTTKAGAFALSAGLAGTAGALQVVLFPFVSHEQFDAFLSLRLYAAAVVGGVASVAGAVYGVLALILVPSINDAAGLLDNDTLVFGIGLIVLTLLAPGGIAEWVRRAGRDPTDADRR
jgi:branched-chain amino acid transport system permease protein